MALLYHCFPRKRQRIPAVAAAEWEQAKAIFSSILDDGLYLTEEIIRIPWDDPFGHHKSTETDIIQYRFCLTSLSEDDDLRGHCQVFGHLGIGFGLDDIRQLGGFPVFYLPAPSANASKSADRLQFTGVSLLYRLAEIRSVLEAVNRLPPRLRPIQQHLMANVADYDNLMGAIRFLGNMLYFTDHLQEHDAAELRYYKQREWRIIAGLGAEKAVTEEVQLGQKTAYALRALGRQPVRELIQEVVLCGSPAQQRELEAILQQRRMKTTVRMIAP